MNKSHGLSTKQCAHSGLALDKTATPVGTLVSHGCVNSSVAAVAFRRENPDAPHSSQHDQWAEQKRASGWSYGAVRDDAAKKHPMLIPYDELPPEERQKDALVSAIVPRTDGACGFCGVGITSPSADAFVSVDDAGGEIAPKSKAAGKCSSLTWRSAIA